MDTVYYTRKCISCLNKVRLAVSISSNQSHATCPICKAVVRIWP